MYIWNLVFRGEDVTPFVSYQHRLIPCTKAELVGQVPARISQVQVGLHRDLGMVREFAMNIER